MPLITGRKNVIGIYEEASKNKWVLPCFCTENLTTTEAILSATKEYGENIGIKDLPVIIAITNRYGHRSQSSYYTQTGRWDIGLKLFLADLRVLTAEDSPFADLRVMIHLDHTQYDTDSELLTWDMERFSSIMYDASKLPFKENIELTRQFVREQGAEIVIEGACDEIIDAEENEKSKLTTVNDAKEYSVKTGVDLIVANLGTEHRASNPDLKYCGERAREISSKIGKKIVLHGTSSVPVEQVKNLFDDGVCKVNIWTTLERDTTPILFQKMVENASKAAGIETVEKMKKSGLLGSGCKSRDRASLEFFTTYYRQNIIFKEMKKIAIGYFKIWYI